MYYRGHVQYASISPLADLFTTTTMPRALLGDLAPIWLAVEHVDVSSDWYVSAYVQFLTFERISLFAQSLVLFLVFRSLKYAHPANLYK